MLSIATRIFKEVLRDKRTLALILVAPLLIMTLLYFLMKNVDEDNTLKVGYSNLNKNTVQFFHDANNVKIYEFNTQDDIRSKIRQKELSAFIYEENNTIHVINDNTNPTETKQLEMLLTQSEMKIIFDDLEKTLTEVETNLKKLKESGVPVDVPNFTPPKEKKISDTYLYGDEDTNYFDVISPVLIVFFVFFFTFLISGISLLKERTSGTLEKMLSAPIHKSSVIFGYLLGYGSFAVIQTLVVILYAIYVLKMESVGHIVWIFVTALLVAILALSLGLLLSTFASSEFQMIQFIPLVVVPQIFFAGIINVDTMHSVLQWIAKLMPLYYAGNATQDIMLKGYGSSELWFNWMILFGMFALLLVINLVGMKKYRKV